MGRLRPVGPALQAPHAARVATELLLLGRLAWVAAGASTPTNQVQQNKGSSSKRRPRLLRPVLSSSRRNNNKPIRFRAYSARIVQVKNFNFLNMLIPTKYRMEIDENLRFFFTKSIHVVVI
jgi:hypothetical protein